MATAPAPMRQISQPLRINRVRALNAQTGTTYTPVIADSGKIVTLSNASPIAVTIPANSSVAYEIGAELVFIVIGAGQATFTAGIGVTLLSSTGFFTSAAQYSVITATKDATDTWVLDGGLTSAFITRRTIRTVSGTSDTPTASDFSSLIKFTSSSTTTITLDATGFTTGDWFDCAVTGSGTTSFAAAGGNTILPGAATFRTAGSAATVTYLGSSVWLVVGDFLKSSNRVITSISSPATAAAVTGFDYAYLVSGTTTLTLPTAVGNTSCYTVKNSGSNTVSIGTTSSQTIDGGAAPITISAGESLNLISDNANWWVV